MSGPAVWKSVLDGVGATPLIHLRSVSEACGARVFGKAEFLNPGGSVKDRIARFIVEREEREGRLRRGGTLVEGTAGNTGIGVAIVGAVKGYRVVLFIPETMTPEKIALVRAYGVDVRLVPKSPWTDPNHYNKQAKAYARRTRGAVFVNQFHNPSNVECHFRTTGPEIWKQTGGKIDLFVTGMGTSGTIVGVGTYLKKKKKAVRVVVSDPYGSKYYHWYRSCEDRADGGSTLEGVGIGQIPECYDPAPIDDVIRIEDEAAVCMAHHLTRAEGLCVGGSSGLGVAAAYRLARTEGLRGKTIVTVLCDTGTRYMSRLYDEAWLRQAGLLDAARGPIERYCAPAAAESTKR